MRRITTQEYDTEGRLIKETVTSFVTGGERALTLDRCTGCARPSCPEMKRSRGEFPRYTTAYIW